MTLAGGAPLTRAIAIVTALAWLVAVLAGAERTATDQGGFIAARLAGPASGFSIPVWFTPLTAALVHGGLFHLGFNVLMLVFCGRDLEPVIGTRPLLALYIAGAYGAAGTQYMWDPQSPIPMIGASGAISAVIAVYALLFSRNEVKRIGPVPSHWVRALWLAVAWTALQWMIGIASAGGAYAVAWPAHVGGFLTGLALARPLLAWRYRSA